MNKQPQLPKSSVSLWTGLVGLVSFVVLFFVFPRGTFNMTTAEEGAVFLFAVVALMAIFELLFIKPYLSKDSGVSFSDGFSGMARLFQKTHFYNLITKLVGLFATLGLMGLSFSIFDLYHEETLYQPFIEVISRYWVWIFAASSAYFLLMHSYISDHKDGYWYLGRMILFCPTRFDWAVLKTHFLSVLIRIFFLPLEFGFFVRDWRVLQSFDWLNMSGFSDFYTQAYRFALFIDVGISMIGYMMMMRLFNAHVRWVQKTAGGWFFCILCYFPFSQIVYRQLFNYNGDGFSWGRWLWDSPVLYVLWGSVILLLTVIYVITEASHGLRFSNLTHRGIYTHGFFRWSKHPAFISKNISWWMIAIPFVSPDIFIAIKGCLLLIGINIVLYIRARYEEACLLEDTIYKQYYDYIHRYGLFAPLRRIFERGKARIFKVYYAGNV